MFPARPRNLRTFLHDASIKALKCANEVRTGVSGDPAAAGSARIVAASLAEVRDALDLRAPWLTDLPQVAYVLEEVARVAGSAPFRIAMPTAELARLIVEEARAEPGGDGDGEGVGAQ
ncbi:hypothetical protein ACFV42_46510 [Streptomyces solisilvae]|uniref:hypothetical protein n=1 Tax=Streptomyces malaysiensis TaxID=92644 RepID=UPI0036BCBB70